MAAGQGQSTQAAPATAPATASPLLRANANLVLVDVVVTDKGNTPVHGVDRSRFHVFENGKEQPITAFDEHRPATAPPDAAAVAAQIAALPPHTYTNTPVYPDAPAINVLLLDALNTPVADQAEARRQMIQYMSTIKPGTSLAIFTLSSQLRLVEGFTTDAARLAAALKNKSASSSQSVMIESQNNSAQTDIEQAVANMDSSVPGEGPNPEAVAAMLQFEADLTVFQTGQRVRMTLDAMEQLARYLSAIPGRKNLIWFSGSFPITLDPDDNQTSYRNVETFADQIRQTSDLLTAARVAVYPVDARGLMTVLSSNANYTPSPNTLGVSNRGKMSRGSTGANVAKDADNSMTTNLEEHGSMKTLAEETGGKAFVNTNDLKEAVADAVENGSSYYTIGFAPGGKKLDGHYRRIKLTLDNGSVNLAYRHGYYADPTDKPSAHNPGAASAINSASLHGAPPSTQVIFLARVLPATDPEFKGLQMPAGAVGEMAATLKGPLHRYLVDLAVDPHGFAVEEMPDGVRQAHLEFVLTGYDADGNRVNYVDRSYAIAIKPDRYEWTMEHGVRARMAIDLPAGHDFLRVSVLDMLAGRTGALEVHLPPTSK
jgi:VWFA-related protein